MGLIHAQYEDDSENEADIEGFVYGVGAALNLSESIGLDIDYAMYQDGEYDDADVDIETQVLAIGTFFTF